MSTARQEQFYRRYKYPVVEELVIGFSGIDPPLKQDAQEMNHEDLDGLLGGDENGHYHLTREQIEQLMDMYDAAYLPKILPNQVIDIIPNEEMTPYMVQGLNVRND